jgi:hypothetical protein
VKRILVAAIAAVLCFPHQPLAAQGDQAQVLAAVTGFLDGMRARDTARIAASIDSVTRFTLIRPGPSGSRVVVLKGTDFLKMALRTDQPPLDEPIRDPKVMIDGDLATVWTEYQVRQSGKVSHCGYDSFQLARLGGKWKIINVSDSFRQEGCGSAW